MMHRGSTQKIFTAPAVIVHAQNVQQRRFTCAGRTHYRDKVAFLDFQVDVAQYVKKLLLRQGIRAFQILKFDHIVYSARNAWTGSTHVARLAGNHVAISAAIVRTSGATVNAIGSSAPTPYRIPLKIFAVAMASNRPMASPLINMMEPSHIIIRNTAPA